MKVSIIIPVYNVEDYIEECLSSVNYIDIDYEIVIVNDGSTDSSLDKIKAFAVNYSGKIKIINKPNGGLSSARNVGILNSSGDYLFFLDSDDYIDVEQFVSFANSVIQGNVDMGFADFKYLIKDQYVENKRTQFRRKITQSINSTLDGISFGERYFDRKSNFFNVEACFLLLKSSLLKEHNLYFKEGIYHEDTLFTLSCLAYAKAVRYYDNAFYIYRMRDGSIMHTDNPIIIEKKKSDKGLVSLELFNLKKKLHISATYLDTLIVDLLLVSVNHGKMFLPAIGDVLANCTNLTLKSHIRVLLFRIISLFYDKK